MLGLAREILSRLLLRGGDDTFLPRRRGGAHAGGPGAAARDQQGLRRGVSGPRRTVSDLLQHLQARPDNANDLVFGVQSPGGPKRHEELSARDAERDRPCSGVLQSGVPQPPWRPPPRNPRPPVRCESR